MNRLQIYSYNHTHTNLFDASIHDKKKTSNDVARYGHGLNNKQIRIYISWFDVRVVNGIYSFLIVHAKWMCFKSVKRLWDMKDKTNTIFRRCFPNSLMLVVRSVWCDIEVSPAFTAKKHQKMRHDLTKLYFYWKTHTFSFLVCNPECYIKLVKVVQGISVTYVASVVYNDMLLGQIAILDYLDK